MINIILVGVILVLIALIFYLKNKKRWGCQTEKFRADNEAVKLRTGKCIQTAETGPDTYDTKVDCDKSQVCLIPQKFKCNDGQCSESPDGTYITHPTPEGGDISAYSRCQNECALLDSGTYTLKTNRGARNIVYANRLQWQTDSGQIPVVVIYDKVKGTIYVNDVNTPGYLSVNSANLMPILSSDTNEYTNGWTIYKLANTVRIKWMGVDSPTIKNGWTLVSSDAPPLFVTNNFTQTVDTEFTLQNAQSLKWACQMV